MKKLGLTLVAALAFSASVFAQEKADATPQQWDGTINKAKFVFGVNGHEHGTAPGVVVRTGESVRDKD